MTSPAPASHHLDKRAQVIRDHALTQCGEVLFTPQVVDGLGKCFTTRELATILGTSVEWLEVGRGKGYGPPASKLGKHYIRYRYEDVVAWLESCVRRHTAEYTKRPSEAAAKSAEQPAAASAQSEA